MLSFVLFRFTTIHAAKIQKSEQNAKEITIYFYITKKYKIGIRGFKIITKQSANNLK